ncbi:MAG: ankyrin repeat domain-containing protein [Pseudomonadota bacterium]
MQRLEFNSISLAEFTNAVNFGDENSLTIVERYIAQDGDVNVIDSNNISPILHAVNARNTELVRILLTAPRINMLRDGTAALGFAIQFRHRDIFMLLLHKVIDKDVLEDARDDIENYNLSTSEKIYFYTSIVDRINVLDLNSIPSYSEFLLATEEGDEQVVTKYIALNQQCMVDIINDTGRFLEYYDHVHAFDNESDESDDIEEISDPNECSSFLACATRGGHERVIRILLNNTPINLVDLVIATVIAGKYRHTNIFSILFDTIPIPLDDSYETLVKSIHQAHADKASFLVKNAESIIAYGRAHLTSVITTNPELRTANDNIHVNNSHVTLPIPRFFPTENKKSQGIQKLQVVMGLIGEAVVAIRQRENLATVSLNR